LETTTTHEELNKLRIGNQARAGKILQGFVEKGFTTFKGFESVCMYYDADLTRDELVLFWRLNAKITAELCDKVEYIIEQKLRQE